MWSCASEQRSPDALVIGGGLIGCSVALRLAQAKLRVCVLGRSRLDLFRTALRSGRRLLAE